MSKVSEARRVEERYLSERTLSWLEGVTGQRLTSLGLSLGPLLKNGKVLKLAGLALEKNASSAKPLSKSDLTEERKGFRAVDDVGYFLTCCRTLGLKDHELFVASDVTTSGDLLRVCRAVRSLSLRCRERGIEVSRRAPRVPRERTLFHFSTKATEALLTR